MRSFYVIRKYKGLSCMGFGWFQLVKITPKYYFGLFDKEEHLWLSPDTDALKTRITIDRQEEADKQAYLNLPNVIHSEEV